MNNAEVDDDSIDLDALQAQIDMSMSFAQEMVSSWVKPSKGMPSKANKDIEAELKEYLRRPPRLGVGAVVSESQVSSRDIARLKVKLVGKGNKRLRQVEPDVNTALDCEEESRVNVIRKRIRPDPFGTGKKKKDKPIGESGISSPTGPLKWIKSKDHEIHNTVVDDAVPHPSPVAAIKRSKEEEKRNLLDHSHVKHESLASHPSPAVVEEVVDCSLITPQSVTDEARSSRPTKIVLATYTSTSTSPLQTRRLVQTAALLQQPLLNLDSPLRNNETESDTNARGDIEGTTPTKRKRRKRRKKKGGNSVAAKTFSAS